MTSRSWLHSDVMENNKAFASEYFSAMFCFHILIIQMFAIFFQPTIAATALANSEILPGKSDFLYLILLRDRYFFLISVHL